MADLVILPLAYLNGYAVSLMPVPERPGFVRADIRLPIAGQFRLFSATAANHERALQDLREAVELAEHGVVAQSLAGSKH